MNYTPVIARAYGGEPLKRVAVSNGNGLIYIAKPSTLNTLGTENGVGFPEKDVFFYEKEAFRHLQSQWESAGKTEPEAWAKLRRYR